MKETRTECLGGALRRRDDLITAVGVENLNNILRSSIYVLETVFLYGSCFVSYSSVNAVRVAGVGVELGVGVGESWFLPCGGG